MTREDFHRVRVAYLRNMRIAEPEATDEHIDTFVAVCMLRYVAADTDRVLFEVEPGKRPVLPKDILHRAAVHLAYAMPF